MWSRIPAPETFDIVVPGWHENAGGRSELNPENGVRLEADRQYLLAAIKLYDGSWSLDSSSSAFEVRDDEVHLAEEMETTTTPPRPPGG